MIDELPEDQDFEMKRRWRVPPPLLHDPGAPGPQGINVLKEFQDEVGAVLWKSLRNVLLWGECSPEDRSELFPRGSHEGRRAEILAAEPDPEVEGALVDLAGILARPGSMDPERIALACTRVAAWAEEQGKPLTSLEFFQAAAIASPLDPHHALRVARATRDRAQYERAEAWLQRAIGLARRAKDWDAYARAYIALGNMMRRRGAYPAARHNLTKALRRAVRQGQRETEGMALHDLFVLEYECGNTGEAQKLAARALRAYGRDHALIPALAHDLAYAWLHSGLYERALPVFKAAYDRVAKHHLPGVLGSIARASGAMGDQSEFERAWRALSELDPGPGVAEAWTDAARGAVSLGDWDEARDAARHAERIATERGEAKITFTAESILEDIHAEERAQESMREADRTEEEWDEASADRLADTLLQRLETAGPPPMPDAP